ncbi:hypothetical protein [uncultured Tateyamaria sp.]|uniref:hypothetical protein n=1 Tax=uncultured Tateyamaria sp. TaxID=455651 RepID=UPI002636D004|nr:hypothetical protein [uncultured Tateyamaria sp.]
MGGYTGSRTQHALQRTKSAHSEVDFDRKLAEAVIAIKRFLSEGGKQPSFSFLANVCEIGSHKDCLNVGDIEAINFGRWRLATELRLLHWRIDASTPLVKSRWSPTSVSTTLHLAISLALTGRQTLASPILHKLAQGIEPVLAKMSSRKDKTRDWGAIAFVFRAILEANAVPKLFHSTNELSLKQAMLARPTYCDAGDPYGALLAHFGADLIPVEIIFLSRALGHIDADMVALDEGIRTTGYPTNEAFQEIDMELSVAGI